MAELQILSDLHLESPSAYDIFDLPAKASHLALLGDVGNVRDGGFFPFIETQLRNFRTVFFLLGNHEPYYSSWEETRTKIREFAREVHKRAETDPSLGLGEFVVLDRTRYDLSEDVTVLGCTLYSHVSAEQEESVSFSLNDFYHINDWIVEAHNAAHAADVAWLNEQVAAISASEPDRTIVIFTHHSPTMRDTRAVDPEYAGSAISSAFATDLSTEECWKSARVALWAFGHTHFNCDFSADYGERSKKRLVSNQRGYYFRQATNFDVEKVVRV